MPPPPKLVETQRRFSVRRWVGTAEAGNPLKGFAPAAVSWTVTACPVSFQRLSPVSYLLHF